MTFNLITSKRVLYAANVAEHEIGYGNPHVDALRDALLRDTKAPNLYQVAGIYALTARSHPEDRREAFALLWSALKTGFGLDLVESDRDLDPVRKDPEFQRLVRSARALPRK